MARDSTLFDRIGADALRAVITDFYARLFGDVMIGFLFEGKDRQRLIDKEYELTARFLGADIPYTGKPMREAHARSPILGGHFERRIELLRQTLAAHAVDAGVVESWLAHTEAFRAQVTADKGSECQGGEAEKMQPPVAEPRMVRLGKRP